MIFKACPREPEIAELLHSGRWPAVCSTELDLHVSSCRRCSDLVLVKQALHGLRVEAVSEARLDSPGVLLWRAQLRRRNAAFASVGRPIAGAQIFALLTFILVAFGLVASQAKHGIQWMSWFDEAPQMRAFHLETLWSFSFMRADWNLMILIPTLGALAILSGVVLYLASEKQ
jgi:hypothetical protein